MQLRTTIRRFPNETAWRDIRHYSGRLASWAKSTLFVLRAVYEERLLAPTFTVIGTKDKLVTCRTKSDSILGSPTTLTDLINRHSSSGDLNRDLLKHQIYSDIFLLRWQNVLRGQKVHAKVAMLDHFHRYRLSFARGEPYIGCSKPSCYCCNAYMSAHPLKTQERPSHGNIWVQSGIHVGSRKRSQCKPDKTRKNWDECLADELRLDNDDGEDFGKDGTSLYGSGKLRPVLIQL